MPATRALPNASLIPSIGLERVMITSRADHPPNVLSSIISSSAQQDLLELLGPSALVYVMVNENNYRSIPLLEVDTGSSRVTDPQSLFFGFRNAETFSEWLSLRFFVVCSLLASVTSPVLLTTRTDGLVGRCRSTCKALLSDRGIVLAKIIKATYMLCEGPEAAVWGSNLVWKSFGQRYGNKPDTSKLRICNLIRLVAALNQQHARSKRYASQGRLVLSVHSLLDPNIQIASTRKKSRYEIAKIMHPIEDYSTIEYEFDTDEEDGNMTR